MPRVQVTSEAAEELEEAAARYERQVPGLGTRLLDAFEHALVLLQEEYPPLTNMSGKAAELGAKRLLLHRFPFSVVTIQKNTTFVVVAVAHHSRRPGYWADRLGA